MPTKRRKKTEDLPMLHPDAAGIDVGASELFVAVAANRDPEPVRSYPTFTRDLLELVDWLLSCGIRSVAMESTSVYWIPVYQILEARGIEVFLVNAHYLKNVPGRKSDVSDCQSIQYLYSVGLLRASFRPPGVICAIRSLWRHRGSLIEMAAEHVMHIQKALDQMNLQIHRVLSDITGVSGLRILDARKVKILEHAETMGDWPTRFERPWQDVTRQFWTPVTLCYISIPGGSLGNRSARNHDWIQTDRILDHTTIRQECLDPMIVFGEGSLYRHLQNFINYLSPEPDAFGIGEGQPRIVDLEGATAWAVSA